MTVGTHIAMGTVSVICPNMTVGTHIAMGTVPVICHFAVGTVPVICHYVDGIWLDEGILFDILGPRNAGYRLFRRFCPFDVCA